MINNNDILISELVAKSNIKYIDLKENYPILGSSIPWFEIKFDDLNWTKDINLPTVSNIYSIYLRNIFNVSKNFLKNNFLQISITYTGGFILFVNGKEFIRENLGPVNSFVYYDQLAYNSYMNRTVEIIIDNKYLIDGENLIAIQINNCFIDIPIKGEVSSNVTLGEWKYFLGTTEPSGGVNNFTDWIKLYNKTDNDINLKDIYITDDKEDLKWKFPEIIIPGKSYLLVIADDRDIKNTNETGFLHTNFKLSGDGEYIGLFNNNKTLINELFFPKQHYKYSYGLKNNEMKYLYPSNPFSENSNNTFIGFLKEPLSNKNAGLYNNAIDILLYSEEPNVDIYYTLDGTDPSKNSYKYNNPINISTNTIIKAQAYKENYIPSKIITKSYFINLDPEIKSIPIISLVGDPNNTFYHPNGIFSINGGIYGELWNNSSLDGKIWHDTAVTDYNIPLQKTYYKKQVKFLLSNSSVIENVMGATVGFLSIPYSNKNYIFSLSGTSEDEVFFEVIDNKIKLKDSVSANIKTKSSYYIYILASLNENTIVYSSNILINVIKGNKKNTFQMKSSKVNFNSLSDGIIYNNFILKKTSSDNSWNTGAVSDYSFDNKSIIKGFKVTPGQSDKYIIIGLSSSTNINSYTDVDFALYIYKDGLIYIYESGENIGLFGNYKLYYELSIILNNLGQIEYRINHETIYVSKKIPSYPLFVKSYFYSASYIKKIFWLSNNIVNLSNRPAERECSFEWMDLNNSYQTNVGIRIASSGYSIKRLELLDIESNNIWNSNWNSKPSINLYFRQLYGLDRLEYPIFNSDNVINNFDSLRLRAGKNDINPFIVDELVRRLHSKMGAIASYGNFVNLFINGIFKGYYNLCERLREPFFQKKYNSSNNWIVRDQQRVVDGNIYEKNNTDLNYYLYNDLSIDENYDNLKTIFDIQDFIDYLLINIYCATFDWPLNNFYTAIEDSLKGKMRFYIWDAEGAFGINDSRKIDYNILKNNLLIKSNGFIPSILNKCIKNKKFKSIFSNRVNKHFFNNGALTKESIKTVYNELSNIIKPILNYVGNKQDFQYNDDFLLYWINNREEYVLNQLKEVGLWNDLVAPNIILNDNNIIIESDYLVYYRTDNFDPIDFEKSSIIYTEPININVNIIKARSVNSDGIWSPIAIFKPNIITDEYHNICINEFMADNDDAVTENGVPIQNEIGEYSDWLELYNKSDIDINIGGLFITDNLDKLENNMIPKDTIIPGKGHLVFWCDDKISYGNNLHLFFKLKKNGESIFLLKPDGETIIDSIIYGTDSHPKHISNKSYGRIPDGSSNWDFLENPKPGFNNSNYTESNIIIDEIVARSNDRLLNYQNNKYPVLGSSLPWYRTEFDDSKWANSANLEYNFTNINSLYLRNKFNLTNVEPLLLKITYSGGFLLFVNNFELIRENLGPENSFVYYDQYAYNNYSNRSVEIVIDDKYLLTGSNIISLQINNNSETIDLNITVELVKENNNWKYFKGITEPSGGISNFADWFSLYNTSNDDINMENYYLTDNKKDLKWQFPNMIFPAKSHLVLIADDKDIKNINHSGYLHTNFKLSGDGEYIGLFDNNKVLINEIYYPLQHYHYSYGLVNGQMRYLYPSNPGKKNSVNGLISILNEPIFDKNGGIYDNEILLNIFSEDNGIIYYTTDGSIPNNSSYKYTNSIKISKNKVIRAKVFKNNFVPSKIITKTFLINIKPEIKTIPIISLVGDPRNTFYLPNGIFSINGGIHSNSGWEYTNPNDYNYVMYKNDTNERECSFEWINSDKIKQVDVGIRVAASSYSRKKVIYQNLNQSPWENNYKEKPSMNIYFRKSYGTELLDYPILSSSNRINKFESLRLRAGNDDLNPFVIDELMRRLHSNMGSVAVHGIFVSLFINSEFKGYYNLCERIRGDFLRKMYNTSSEWDIVTNTGIVEGNNILDLNYYIYTVGEDLKFTENYNRLKSILDIEKFIDVLILNIYGATRNWPDNNRYMVKEKSEGAKIMFYLWDTEGAFGNGAINIDYNMFNFELNRSNGIQKLFKFLQLNEEFQKTFSQRVNKFFYNNGALTKENIFKVYDELKNEIKPILNYVGENQGFSFDEELIPNWINNRQEIVLDQFKEKNLWKEENLIIDNSNGWNSIGVTEEKTIDQYKLENGYSNILCYRFDQNYIKMSDGDLLIPGIGYIIKII